MAALERSCSDCNNVIKKDKVDSELTLNKLTGRGKINATVNETKNTFKTLEKSSK